MAGHSAFEQITDAIGECRRKLQPDSLFSHSPFEAHRILKRDQGEKQKDKNHSPVKGTAYNGKAAKETQTVKQPASQAQIGQETGQAVSDSSEEQFPPPDLCHRQNADEKHQCGKYTWIHPIRQPGDYYCANGKTGRFVLQ